MRSIRDMAQEYPELSIYQCLALCVCVTLCVTPGLPTDSVTDSLDAAMKNHNQGVKLPPTHSEQRRGETPNTRLDQSAINPPLVTLKPLAEKLFEKFMHVSVNVLTSTHVKQHQSVIANQRR